MIGFRTIVLAVLVALAAGGRADAYFVIALRDGGELRADFVREEGGKLFATRGQGEIELDKARVRSVTEVEPGVKLAPESATTIPPAASSAASPSTASPTVDSLRDRDDKVVRQIILGHRDLLFARLRGDSQAELEKRRRELDALEQEREGIRKQMPSWERDGPR